MGLKTKTNNNVSERRSKIIELKEKHEKLFELEGIESNKVKFIPKMAYIPEPGAERIIALFPSEIMGGEDIYTEFVSKTNVPEDPERTLWKWPFNPEFDTEYKKSEPHPATGHQRYLIPVDELINVAELHHQKPKPAKQTELDLAIEEILDELDDSPINQMTMRDKAAIDWKLPVSKKEWLNKLILETFK